MNKKQLVDAFREISTLESNRFKSLAYLNAVKVLEEMSDDEFNDRKSFLNIRGIGMSINTKILDFKNNGILPAKLYKLREENKSYLDPQVYKIRKGFVTKRISYNEAYYLIRSIESEIFKNCTIFGDLNFLGSFRRRKPMIADIDLLVENESDYLEVCNLFSKLNEFEFVVGGPVKTTYVVKNSNKTTIDISWCKIEEVPFSKLHFTGSAAHNIKLRSKAKELGYTLNQYGLYKIGTNEKISGIKTEEDIFNFLKLPYVSPENR